jgi:sugar/nucleoside kinase (ribokinase family)|tara:strand:+ start:354 stop:626 length:273 start_codon:yes stop_codon:yes gene_type:complete
MEYTFTLKTNVEKMVETVIGKEMVEELAKTATINGVPIDMTPDQAKALILTDYNGKMCKEFVKAVRAVIKSREDLQDFIESELKLIREMK